MNIKRSAGTEQIYVAADIDEKFATKPYADGTDLKRKMAPVAQAFETELDRRAISVKPAGESVKPENGLQVCDEETIAVSKTCDGTVGWSRTTDLRSHNPTL